MENIGLLTEYESILLGKRRDFSSAYMGAKTLQKSVVSIFRFAFENLLEWTPQMVRDHTTPELIDALHLRKPLNKIAFPPELDKKNDLFYIGWMLYPETIHCTKKTLTLRAYEKVLDGILTKFPKNFFSEAEGDLNASICLQYAINQHLHFASVEELYMIFADKQGIIQFLKDVKLYTPCMENYEYPIDMLHNSLPESEQNLLHYYYGRFICDMENYKERNAKFKDVNS